jgi:hypothetical protein
MLHGPWYPIIPAVYNNIQAAVARVHGCSTDSTVPAHILKSKHSMCAILRCDQAQADTQGQLLTRQILQALFVQFSNKLQQCK